MLSHRIEKHYLLSIQEITCTQKIRTHLSISSTYSGKERNKFGFIPPRLNRRS
jgi:hypothetical protein